MKHKVKRALQRMVAGIIRSRQERAARELAHYLVTSNSDFRGMSEHQLARCIMSKRSLSLAECQCA